MGWFLLLGFIIFIVFIISKSGKIEIPKNTIDRKQVEYNLKEYPGEYIFSVSGVHLDEYLFPILNYCKELDLVVLVPEPNNSYEKNAIKVEVSGWHIGYVPSDETFDVFDIINKDHIAYVHNINIDGYIIVNVNIRYKY
jgi:hypothetical protein